MKRAEYEEKLRQFNKSNDQGYVESMVDYFLRVYDEDHRELGYVASLRESLALAVKGKVEAEIEVQELQQKLEHALRTRKEAGEANDD